MIGVQLVDLDGGGCVAVFAMPSPMLTWVDNWVRQLGLELLVETFELVEIEDPQHMGRWLREAALAMKESS